MNILITGNLKQISSSAMHKLTAGNIILVQEGEETVQLAMADPKNQINTVVFFSHALDGEVKMYDEFEKLEQVVYGCKKYDIKNFIYVTTNDSILLERVYESGYNSRYVILQACRQLLENYSEQNHIHFSLLYLPYLYSIESEDNQLFRTIRQAVESKRAEFRGTDYQETDYVCDEDVFALLNQVIEKGQQHWFLELYLSNDTSVTLREMGALLKVLIPEVEIVYHNLLSCIPKYRNGIETERLFGWKPTHHLKADVKTIIDKVSINQEKGVEKTEKTEDPTYKAKDPTIFSASIEHIDSLLPDEILYEVLQKLEEIMKNTSVAIYSVSQDAAFARLIMCSKAISSDLKRSVRITDYSGMQKSFECHEVFSHIQSENFEPAVAVPVFSDNNLKGILMLWRVNNDQRTRGYIEQFKVFVGMAHNQIVRALSVDANSADFLPGTQILNCSRFYKVYKVKKQMRDRKYLDFIQLRLHYKGMTLGTLSEKVTRVVRMSDDLGQGVDGQIYLLLNQSRVEESGKIVERLKNQGITCDVLGNDWEL